MISGLLEVSKGENFSNLSPSYPHGRILLLGVGSDTMEYYDSTTNSFIMDPWGMPASLSEQCNVRLNETHTYVMGNYGPAREVRRLL